MIKHRVGRTRAAILRAAAQTVAIALAGIAPALLAPSASAQSSIRPQRHLRAERLPAPVKPLSAKAFKKILADYQFLADFNQKPDRPKGADPRFFRYPIPLRAPKFPLVPLTATKEELITYFPATRGDGRDIERLNIGRNQLRSGRYEDAWRTLRDAKEIYGGTSPFNRRIDYMIGYANLNRALKIQRRHPSVRPKAFEPPPSLKKKKKNPLKDPETEKGGKKNTGSSAGNLAAAAKAKHTLSDEEAKAEALQAKLDKLRTIYDNSLRRAARALAWAYINKMDQVDPVLEKAGPASYYNLAVLYTMRGNWGEAHTAAHTGISFLQRHDDKSFRPELRRMMAEAFVQNRTYWEAITQLDFALRQDPDIHEAAKIFGRAADIYFDLNNFPIAAEVYLLAIRVNQLAGGIDPNHYVLRGEALFWQKRYKEARVMFQYGLTSQYQSYVESPLRPDLEDLASIRMADTALALGKVTKARQAYFEHADIYRSADSATHAKLQLICLELPKAKGKNIRHFHDVLANHKQPLPDGSGTFMPAELIEVVHTCETDSFYRHKNGDELLNLVRKFAAKYPQSVALNAYRPKLISAQKKGIDDYFAKGDAVGAVAFFEQNRKSLFKKVSWDLSHKLFFAYVRLFHSEKAAPFYTPDIVTSKDPHQLLAAGIYLAESSLGPYGKRQWRDLKTSARALGQQSPDVAWPAGDPLVRRRLLTAKGREVHGGWLLRHALISAEQDPALYCERVLPIVAMLKPRQYRGHRTLAQQTAAAVTRHMAKADGCFHEALQLEANLNSHRPLAYGKLLLSRTELPVTAHTRDVMFTAASLLSERSSYSTGAKQVAEREDTSRKLWQWVAKNGLSIQKKLADLKLNPSKTDTVTEGLWQSFQNP